jgi:5,10-methylenetetrahydromethanopterin reductase
MLPVTLAENGGAANTLDWSPNLPVTAPWGVKELGTAKAPADDIDGRPRSEWQGVGAAAVTVVKPPRPADGTFDVASGAGVASAGLYTKAGDLVAYLFHNQPLPKGRYEFWLPSRTWTGQPIAAGDYELKVTEADLAFEYVAAAGNGDAVTSAAPMTKSGSRLGQDPQMVAFPPAGGLILVRSGFESHVHVQSFSADLHTFHWALQGGGETKAAGVAIDDKGRFCLLRQTDGSVLRLDAATGEGAAFAGSTLLKILDKPWTDAKNPGEGLTFWNGTFVSADPAANQLVLWNGETVDRAGTASRIRWYESLAVESLVVVIACTRPQTIRMAVDVGDRVSFAVGSAPERLRWAMDTALARLAETGRPRDSIRIGAYVNLVCDPDEQRAIQLGRMISGMVAHFAGMKDAPLDHLPPRLKDLAAKMQSGYDMKHHAQESGSHLAAVPDDFVDWFSICGPPAKCRERLGELLAMGLDHVYQLGGSPVPHPHGARQEAMVRQAALYASEVIPHFR